MAHLGEFGRAVEDFEGEPDTFLFKGELFEIPSSLSWLVLGKLAKAARDCQDRESDAEVRRAKAETALAHATTPADRDAARAEIDAAKYASQEAGVWYVASMVDYIRACIGEEQWERFELASIASGASQEELTGVAGAVYSAVTARPTRRPSSSAAGPSTTGDGSTDGSASLAVTPGPRPPDTASQDSETVDGQVLQLPPRRDLDVQMVTVDDILAGRIPSGG